MPQHVCAHGADRLSLGGVFVHLLQKFLSSIGPCRAFPPLPRGGWIWVGGSGLYGAVTLHPSVACFLPFTCSPVASRTIYVGSCSRPSVGWSPTGTLMATRHLCSCPASRQSYCSTRSCRCIKVFLLSETPCQVTLVPPGSLRRSQGAHAPKL